MSLTCLELSVIETLCMTTIKLPEGYVEREPAPELDLVSRIHGRFKGTGEVMPEAQRSIYERLTLEFQNRVKQYRGYPKTIHKPTVADVGCGCGIGSNILSREAQFVWGIDVNEESVNYARQMFAREPNNIYYTPQISFDHLNIIDDPREVMGFDFVVCIEVIEHLPSQEASTLLSGLNRLFKKDKQGNQLMNDERTVLYITTPNRNSPLIQDETPRNEHHCYEPTAGEMYDFLTNHYRHVTVLNKDFELRDLDTTDTPLVYKLEIYK